MRHWESTMGWLHQEELICLVCETLPGFDVQLTQILIWRTSTSMQVPSSWTFSIAIKSTRKRNTTSTEPKFMITEKL
jgi:hypothetical protein